MFIEYCIILQSIPCIVFTTSKKTLCPSQPNHLSHSSVTPLCVSDGLCVVLVQAEAAKNREQNLEEAKSIVISEDTTLSPAKKVSDGYSLVIS